jgi:hypothetical protein
MRNIIELEIPVSSETDSNSKCVSYTNADIQYNDFFRRYLYRNRPCIVRGSITESWKSASEWISDGKPNFSYICQKFGTYCENNDECKRVLLSFIHFGSD